MVKSQKIKKITKQRTKIKVNETPLYEKPSSYNIIDNVDQVYHPLWNSNCVQKYNWLVWCSRISSCVFISDLRLIGSQIQLKYYNARIYDILIDV